MKCVLWGEVASSPVGAGVESVELGRLSVVKLDGLDGLSVLVSWGSVQAIGCWGVSFVPGWNFACKGRGKFRGGLHSFREDSCSS